MSYSESDDAQIEEVIRQLDKSKVKPKADPEPSKTVDKGKRKPRGLITEAQKKALAEGQKIRDENAEIRKLEKGQELAENQKKLEKLRKMKAATADSDEGPKKKKGAGNDEIAAMKKELEELKQLKAQQYVQPPPPQQIAPVVQQKDPAILQEEFNKQLRKYIKF